jgi:predicted N-acetyltransferase YhbS
MMRLLPEAPEYIPARERLLDRCFGPDRGRKTSEMLRSGRRPADGLAFALLEGPPARPKPLLRGEGPRLVGTLRLWHIEAGSAGPALLLGPIAVEPKWQSEGWGAELMRHGLGEAERRGHAAVLLVGDAPYYRRFGFREDLTQRLDLPGPVERERFLGLDLRPGALEGAHGAVVANGAWETARAHRRLMPYPSTPTRLRASAGRS